MPTSHSPARTIALDTLTMTKKRVEPTRAKLRGVRPATRRIPGLALIGILLITFIVYLPSLGNDFTNWDDDAYVTENPLVARPHVVDVLMTPLGGNYHPLTVLSLALNYRISGYQPASYHWLNLLLHLANTGLVFAFVWMLSRRRFWTATATSLFFGIHPMHVESVAWIAERKDVLYTLFYLLGLIAYLRYLERRRWAWFAVCLAAFVLSLASKPAAVVFPLTLLALDYFFRRTDRIRLVLEKLPFLALSIAVGWLTLKAQQAIGAVALVGTWSLFEKAVVRLVRQSHVRAQAVRSRSACPRSIPTPTRAAASARNSTGRWWSCWSPSRRCCSSAGACGRCCSAGRSSSSTSCWCSSSSRSARR